MTESLFWGFCAIALVVVLALLIRLRRLWGGLLFSALSGLGALWAVNASGAFTGVFLPLNLLTLAVSLAGGIPGVILLLIFRLLWGGQ